MQKDTAVRTWPDFTNRTLEILGKFVVLPLIVIGAIVTFLDAFIGILIIFGACLILILVSLVMIALKPIIVKKYPDRQFSVREVSVLVEIPGEAPREVTFKTSGDHIVPSSAPREDLTPIQKLAVDKCQGDMEVALQYLFAYMSKEDQDAYTQNMTPQEEEVSWSLLNVIINTEVPEQVLDSIVEKSYLMTLLDMTEAQIMSAKKNPFVPKLWRCLGGLLLASVAVGVIAGLGHRFVQNESLIATVVVVLGLATTALVYKVVELLINCSRFRKAKRLLEKDSIKE